jgi:peptide/nickel transport system permease protein
MYSYILRRLLYMIPILFLVSVISFAVIQAPPGDYLTTQIEVLRRQYGDAYEEQVEILKRRYGLGEPIHRQYLKWMKGIILRGDFGQSFAENRPVKDIIVQRLPFTILITFLTMIFVWVVSIPIGVFSAVRQYTFFDYLFTFVAFIGVSIPNFMLALILMYVFYTSFGWSLGGLFSPEFESAAFSLAKLFDLAKHLVLPIIVVGTAGTAGSVRVLRGMMLDELGKEYIKTARAKGLSERTVIWKHAFKIAILPAISTIGWILPALVSGAVITSIVLNLPTTGASMYSALMNQDMYVAGSFVLILCVLTVIGTLISDILLVWLDPRIRYD